MLMIKNLTKVLGKKEILQDINICLKKGEVTALVGPNGAGKTTLIRCMTGFYEADKGQISYDDKLLEENREFCLSKMSYVPEWGGFFPEMTVFEYLKYMAKVKHTDEKMMNENIENLLRILDLESVVDTKCEKLSKGYKRRVVIAGALVSNPDVLILDEPTEGLDPKQKKQLRKVLQNYGKNATVLITTHVMEEVDILADRVLMIKNGKIICDSTADNLKKFAAQNKIEEAFSAIIGN